MGTQKKGPATRLAPRSLLVRQGLAPIVLLLDETKPPVFWCSHSERRPQAPLATIRRKIQMRLCFCLRFSL